MPRGKNTDAAPCKIKSATAAKMSKNCTTKKEIEAMSHMVSQLQMKRDSEKKDARKLRNKLFDLEALADSDVCSMDDAEGKAMQEQIKAYEVQLAEFRADVKKLNDAMKALQKAWHPSVKAKHDLEQKLDEHRCKSKSKCVKDCQSRKKQIADLKAQIAKCGWEKSDDEESDSSSSSEDDDEGVEFD